MTDTKRTTEAEFEKHTEAEIQDEDLEKDQRAAGRLFASQRDELRATAHSEVIRNFAESYGDDNPLFADPDYGRYTRWGSQIAPPMVSLVLNRPLRGDKPARELRGGSYRGIHSFLSGGSWDWYRPVRPGDTVYSLEGLESSEVRPSRFAGRLVRRVLRKVKMNQDAEVLGVYRVIFIVTERKAAKQKGKEAEKPEPSYTDEDLAEIDRIYEQEQRRGAEPRYFEDVEVGEALPPMVKGPLRTTDIIVLHAGGYGFTPFRLCTGRLDYLNRQRIPAFYVKNEYGIPDVAQRVHWDSEWAQAVGARKAYDYGVLRELWLHHAVTNWMGDDAWVTHQSDELRGFNYHGDTHWLSGEVAAKREEDGMCLVDLTLRATNQRDEETTTGQATVSLPSREAGPALLPTPPQDLQRAAAEAMARHGELLRTGEEPRKITE